MQQYELKDLVYEIQKQKTERQNVELKASHGGFPSRIYDTLSSFSNQNEGGIIIFGITDKPEYKVVGVYDAEDVQKKIMEHCNQMEPLVRAVITVCEIDGRMIVSAEIPSVELSRRPVFYKGQGRLRGSYVRVGDADEPMTEYEVYSYEAFRRRMRDDLRTVESARFKLFDKERIQTYLDTIKADRENLAKNVSDEDILELMGVTSDGYPTIAGLMTFSQYPQTYFPQLCITAVVVPGTEIGETGDDGERFIDNKRITGAIPDMVKEAVEFVRRNSRTKTIISEDGQRTDKPEYPIQAVREAVLNALIHRDYSIYTEGIPVQIEMYRDRLEITSSGSLFGSMTVDMLGKIRPEARNAALANMLEVLHVTENRYSGIPTIKKSLADAGLPEAIFEVKHGEFKVIFRNNIYNSAFYQHTKGKTTVRHSRVSEAYSTYSSMHDYSAYDSAQSEYDFIDKTNLDDAILAFCQVPRSRAELVAFTGMSRYHTMSAYVQPLVDKGLLMLTLPEKPKSSRQRYVRT